MSMISELIEELIDNADLYTKELHDLMYRAAETIEMLSEKAREPKRGEWIEVPYEGRIYGLYRIMYKCSNCGYVPMHRGEPIIPTASGILRYCPSCGCRMKGADDESD